MVLFMVTYWSEADYQVMTGTHSFDKVTQNSTYHICSHIRWIPRWGADIFWR
jgi:hypothetical protein